MKKLFILIVICFFMSFVHGNIDVEDRDYALILGVDPKENEWKTTWSFADLSKVAETKGRGAESVSVSINGENLKEVEQKYNQFEDKELEYGHLKVLILGKHMLEDTKRYETFLTELRQNNKYSENILVFYTEREASSIVKLDEKMNGLLSDILKRLEKQHIPSKTITLKNVLRGYWEEEEVKVPVLSVEKERPSFVGYKKLPNYIKAEN